MSLKSGTVWWVACDGCGEKPEDGEGYEPVFDIAELAVASAASSGFREVDGKLLCGGCAGERRTEGGGSA